jgi:hypothetical protein
MNKWSYSPIQDKQRHARLEAAPPFGEIAQAVAGSMRIRCTHSDKCDEAAGFMRIVCCVSIDRDLFDLFLNAESGYRGRYFASPEEGLLANGQLLQLVSTSLAAFMVHGDMTTSHAERSLCAPSAKAWLAEVGKDFCPACVGEWTTPQDAAAEILNGRWDIGPTPRRAMAERHPISNGCALSAPSSMVQAMNMSPRRSVTAPNRYMTLVGRSTAPSPTGVAEIVRALNREL